MVNFQKKISYVFKSIYEKKKGYLSLYGNDAEFLILDPVDLKGEKISRW